MLREYQIIVPTRNNTGVFMDDALTTLEYSLAQDFDGFTMLPGQGTYKHYRESVRVYIVAIPSDIVSAVLLTGHAYAYGVATEQGCVYLRHGDGEVELIDTRSKPHA